MRDRMTGSQLLQPMSGFNRKPTKRCILSAMYYELRSFCILLLKHTAFAYNMGRPNSISFVCLPLLYLFYIIHIWTDRAFALYCIAFMIICLLSEYTADIKTEPKHTPVYMQSIHIYVVCLN